MPLPHESKRNQKLEEQSSENKALALASSPQLAGKIKYGGAAAKIETGINLGNHREREKLIQLARQFRMTIREFMTAPDTVAILKQRVHEELTGKMKVVITPLLIRIAAGGNAVQTAGGGGEQLKQPLFNIHLHRMSDEDLRRFAETGERPVGPTVDIKSSEPSDDAD